MEFHNFPKTYLISSFFPLLTIDIADAAWLNEWAHSAVQNLLYLFLFQLLFKFLRVILIFSDVKK